MQQAAFNEISNVIGKNLDEAVTLKDLNGLNYLDLVIKESLRLFPPVPFYGRKISKAFYLSELVN